MADDTAATRRGVEGGRHDSSLDRTRASDNPILGIPLEEYFTVVEQLADELINRRSGGTIDERLTGGCVETVAILDAHGLDGSLCMALLDQLETRCHRTDDASRAVAAYLARRRFGHPAGKVAEALGYRSPSSVTRAVARVESGSDKLHRTAKKLEKSLR